MMKAKHFPGSRQIESARLARWVEAGWLLPPAQDRAQGSSAVDRARAELIHDLIDLGINDEAIPVILALIDQLHGMRRAMRELSSTIAAQPDATRHRIAAGLSETVRAASPRDGVWPRTTD
jgi:chaperone modulatory protein CbpM